MVADGEQKQSYGPGRSVPSKEEKVALLRDSLLLPRERLVYGICSCELFTQLGGGGGGVCPCLEFG